ncbi:MAG: hypothetical protein Kow0080_18290 [Candidatus Promineifilaceae bacterium]
MCLSLVINHYASIISYECEQAFCLAGSGMAGCGGGSGCGAAAGVFAFAAGGGGAGGYGSFAADIH